jgi:predicted metal-binding transcription factor (methanogenesis marker protein 9)
MDNKVPPCPECGEQFDNVFQATDHLLEDDEEFDPALMLPNGAKLMIGSLLRCLYKYADKPDQIRTITQSTYMTLFTAETQPEAIKDIVEEMIIESQMMEIDNELKQLLEEGK